MHSVSAGALPLPTRHRICTVRSSTQKAFVRATVPDRSTRKLGQELKSLTLQTSSKRNRIRLARRLQMQRADFRDTRQRLHEAGAGLSASTASKSLKGLQKLRTMHSRLPGTGNHVTGEARKAGRSGKANEGENSNWGFKAWQHAGLTKSESQTSKPEAASLTLPSKSFQCHASPSLPTPVATPAP